MLNLPWPSSKNQITFPQEDNFARLRTAPDKRISWQPVYFCCRFTNNAIMNINHIDLWKPLFLTRSNGNNICN